GRGLRRHGRHRWRVPARRHLSPLLGGDRIDGLPQQERDRPPPEHQAPLRAQVSRRRTPESPLAARTNCASGGESVDAGTKTGLDCRGLARGIPRLAAHGWALAVALLVLALGPLGFRHPVADVHASSRSGIVVGYKTSVHDASLLSARI